MKKKIIKIKINASELIIKEAKETKAIAENCMDIAKSQAMQRRIEHHEKKIKTLKEML